MPTITRVVQLRRAFWLDHDDLRLQHRAAQPERSHNEYPATVRSEFSKYIDQLQRSGAITYRLALRATLG